MAIENSEIRPVPAHPTKGIANGEFLAPEPATQGIRALIAPHSVAMAKDDESVHVRLPDPEIAGHTASDNPHYDIIPSRFGESDILTARVGDDHYGELEYNEHDGAYTIDSIITTKPGRGAATALLSSFTSLIGNNVQVGSYITHKPTREALLDQPLKDAVRAQGAVVIEDKEKLDDLPFSRVFLSGGIVADKVEVQYDPTFSEDPYIIEFFGTTNSELAARKREQLHARDAQKDGENQ